ncbi:MAG: hypothetical protein AAFN93_04815 [Bacteroidota bacterium]
MKKLLPLILFLLIISTVQGQQIGLQAGQVFSEMRFEDSNGRELENLQSTNHFFMSGEYRTSLFSEGLNDKMKGSIGIGFYGYGATGSDPVLDNFFEWDLAYLAINLGLDYEVYQVGRFAALASIRISPEFMVRGSQTINSQVFDVRGEEDFEGPIIFFRGGLATQFEVTPEATIYAQYLIGQSYSLNSNPGELNLIAQNFGIGIFLNLQSGNQPSRKRPKSK